MVVASKPKITGINPGLRMVKVSNYGSIQAKKSTMVPSILTLLLPDF